MDVDTDKGTPTEAASPSDRERRLECWFREHHRVLVAYSGGVDSTYLAALALRVLGRENVLAVIGRSASVPGAQLDDALAFAQGIGLPVVEATTDELADPEYAANPSNRCYFCKRELWRQLVPIANEQGFDCIVDGTNADDLHDHRPGARAGAENGVHSPLAELGFTKAEVRERSRALGLPTADQPSSPCLSSRVVYGLEVTSDRLATIERAEVALRALGVEGDLRVRHHGPLARVELPASIIDYWLRPDNSRALRTAVVEAGFERVTVDLRGFRSGSLNVLHGVVSARSEHASAVSEAAI